MATIMQQQDGNLLVTLTPIEQDTYSGLPADQLAQYVTIWLSDRSKQVFQDRFAQLAPADQLEILGKFRAVSQPIESVPVVEAPLG